MTLVMQPPGHAAKVASQVFLKKFCDPWGSISITGEETPRHNGDVRRESLMVSHNSDALRPMFFCDESSARCVALGRLEEAFRSRLTEYPALVTGLSCVVSLPSADGPSSSETSEGSDWSSNILVGLENLTSDTLMCLGGLMLVNSYDSGEE